MNPTERLYADICEHVGSGCRLTFSRDQGHGVTYRLTLPTGAVVAQEKWSVLALWCQTRVFGWAIELWWLAQRGKLMVDLSRGRAVVS